MIDFKLKNKWDLHLMQTTWYEEGETKGKIEGEIEANQKTALNLNKMGLAVADISRATGLSIAEVESLTES